MKKWLLPFFITALLIVCAANQAEATTLKDSDTFYTQQVFPDVKKSTDETYYAIQWAYHNGIASGSNGKFNPDGKLTEAQFAKMYAVYFNIVNPAAPTDPADWTNTYYNTLKLYNIPLNGYNSTTVRRAEVKRGTVAQMLAYALGRAADANSAASYLMSLGISKAQNPSAKTPAEQFGVNNSLTRKQAAVFLYRMYKTKNVELKVSSPYTTLTNKEFFLGGTSTAKVVNNQYKALELQFVSDNKVYGGYMTEVGKSLEGYTIGTVLQGNSNVSKNGKNITLLVDKFNGNKIDAIYWLEDSSFASLRLNAINQDFSDKKLTSWEQLMIAVTNVSRAKNGIPALFHENKIAAVAKSHSEYMLKTGDFAHTTKAGQSVQDRLNLTKAAYTAGGENLAANQATVFHAHNAFMNSAAHRPNVLDTDYKQVGIGIAMNNKATYYTVNFITYR